MTGGGSIGAVLRRRRAPLGGVALLAGAAFVSLWIGTPSGWGPFEAFWLVLFGDDPGARTLARARALEVAALAAGGAVQAVACAFTGSGALTGSGRGLLEREGALLTGASAGGWTLFCGYGAGWAGAGAAAGALVGAALTRRSASTGTNAGPNAGAVRRALLAALPIGFLVHALATAPSQGLVWLDAASAMAGDAAGLDAPRAAVLAAASLVAAGALLAPRGPARWLAATGGGVATAAVGWFAGVGLAARLLAPGAGPAGVALAGALVALGGEAALAALTAPGRLPVAAATFPLALALAALRPGRASAD